MSWTILRHVSVAVPNSIVMARVCAECKIAASMKDSVFSVKVVVVTESGVPPRVSITFLFDPDVHSVKTIARTMTLLCSGSPSKLNTIELLAGKFMNSITFCENKNVFNTLSEVDYKTELYVMLFNKDVSNGVFLSTVSRS